MSLDEIKCHNNLVIVKGAKGINKIPKPLSMVDRLDIFLFFIVLEPGVPQTFNSPAPQKFCNC